MENFIKLIQELVEIPTVSGFENTNLQQLSEIAQKYTGIQKRIQVTPTGSVILGICCGKTNAKKLVFDAHIDTIGFMVTKLCEGGFVEVTNIGGVDTGILYSHEVELYGKQTVRGVFVSTPPHLSKDAGKAEISQMLVDTGLSDDFLREICPVGTPCGFYSKLTRLQDDRLSSKSLDDKLCVASTLEALRIISQADLQNTDVYVQLSSGEEKSMSGGNTFAYNMNADACIVLDVNFAKEKTSNDGEYLEFDKGPGVSLSASTSRDLTLALYDSAKSHGHKIQRVVEMASTGTNANVIGKKHTGIQTAVLSIPIKYMHTAVETACVGDALECAKVLVDFVLDCDKQFPVCSFTTIKGGSIV